MAISNEMRKLIVEAYDSGKSIKSIADIFNKPYTTVASIITVYKEEGRYEKNLKGGQRKKALNSEQAAFIKTCIDDDCGITLKELKRKITEKYNKTVSEKTIGKYIKDFSYTLKRVTLIPARRNNPEVVDQRQKYAESFYEILTQSDPKNIIFIDEVGFNVIMRNKIGRSLKGTPASYIVPGMRSKNISVCCAMNKHGILKYLVQDKPFENRSFCIFIKQLFEEILEHNAVIVMDNASFHKHANIKEIFNNSSNKLVFLPPYSPFLNPIENMFAKWKLLVAESRPNNEEQLLNSMRNVASLISEVNCNGYYSNMMKFLPKCLRSEPIIDGN